MRLVFRKSKAERDLVPTTGNDKLEYYRKLIMDHLDKLEDGAIQKSRAMAIGTISDRKGGVRYSSLILQSPEKCRQ